MTTKFISFHTSGTAIIFEIADQLVDTLSPAKALPLHGRLLSPARAPEAFQANPIQWLADHRQTNCICPVSPCEKSPCNWPTLTLVLRSLHVKCFWPISLSIDGE